MASEPTKIGMCEWLVQAHDREGNLVHEEKHENMVVRLGRKDILNHLFNIGTPINTGFVYLGVGSSTTAAAVTQTILVAELTGNANRLTCTNTSSVALSGSDVVQETSSSFDQKIILQAIYDFTDGNNGSTFNEYALFSNATFAAGTMFNRFVASSPVAKDSSIKVTIQLTIRS